MTGFIVSFVWDSQQWQVLLLVLYETANNDRFYC